MDGLSGSVPMASLADVKATLQENSNFLSDKTLLRSLLISIDDKLSSGSGCSANHKATTNMTTHFWNASPPVDDLRMRSGQMFSNVNNEMLNTRISSHYNSEKYRLVHDLRNKMRNSVPASQNMPEYTKRDFKNLGNLNNELPNLFGFPQNLTDYKQSEQTKDRYVSESEEFHTPTKALGHMDESFSNLTEAKKKRLSSTPMSKQQCNYQLFVDPVGSVSKNLDLSFSISEISSAPNIGSPLKQYPIVDEDLQKANILSSDRSEQPLNDHQFSNAKSSDTLRCISSNVFNTIIPFSESVNENEFNYLSSNLILSDVSQKFRFRQPLPLVSVDNQLTHQTSAVTESKNENLINHSPEIYHQDEASDTIISKHVTFRSPPHVASSLADVSDVSECIQGDVEEDSNATMSGPSLESEVAGQRTSLSSVGIPPESLALSERISSNTNDSSNRSDASNKNDSANRNNESVISNERTLVNCDSEENLPKNHYERQGNPGTMINATAKETTLENFSRENVSKQPSRKLLQNGDDILELGSKLREYDLVSEYDSRSVFSPMNRLPEANFGSITHDALLQLKPNTQQDKQVISLDHRPRSIVCAPTDYGSLNSNFVAPLEILKTYYGDGDRRIKTTFTGNNKDRQVSVQEILSNDDVVGSSSDPSGDILLPPGLDTSSSYLLTLCTKLLKTVQAERAKRKIAEDELTRHDSSLSEQLKKAISLDLQQQTRSLREREAVLVLKTKELKEEKERIEKEWMSIELERIMKKREDEDWRKRSMEWEVKEAVMERRNTVLEKELEDARAVAEELQVRVSTLQQLGDVEALAEVSRREGLQLRQELELVCSENSTITRHLNDRDQQIQQLTQELETARVRLQKVGGMRGELSSPGESVTDEGLHHGLELERQRSAVLLELLLRQEEDCATANARAESAFSRIASLENRLPKLEHLIRIADTSSFNCPSLTENLPLNLPAKQHRLTPSMRELLKQSSHPTLEPSSLEEEKLELVALISQLEELGTTPSLHQNNEKIITAEKNNVELVSATRKLSENNPCSQMEPYSISINHKQLASFDNPLSREEQKMNTSAQAGGNPFNIQNIGSSSVQDTNFELYNISNEKQNTIDPPLRPMAAYFNDHKIDSSVLVTNLLAFPSSSDSSSDDNDFSNNDGNQTVRNKGENTGRDLCTKEDDKDYENEPKQMLCANDIELNFVDVGDMDDRGCPETEQDECFVSCILYERNGSGNKLGNQYDQPSLQDNNLQYLLESNVKNIEYDDQRLYQNESSYFGKAITQNYDIKQQPPRSLPDMRLSQDEIHCEHHVEFEKLLQTVTPCSSLNYIGMTVPNPVRILDKDDNTSVLQNSDTIHGKRFNDKAIDLESNECENTKRINNTHSNAELRSTKKNIVNKETDVLILPPFNNYLRTVVRNMDDCGNASDASDSCFIAVKSSVSGAPNNASNLIDSRLNSMNFNINASSDVSEPVKESPRAAREHRDTASNYSNVAYDHPSDGNKHYNTNSNHLNTANNLIRSTNSCQNAINSHRITANNLSNPTKKHLNPNKNYLCPANQIQDSNKNNPSTNPSNKNPNPTNQNTNPSKKYPNPTNNYMYPTNQKPNPNKKHPNSSKNFSDANKDSKDMFAYETDLRGDDAAHTAYQGAASSTRGVGVVDVLDCTLLRELDAEKENLLRELRELTQTRQSLQHKKRKKKQKKRQPPQ